MFDEQPDGDPHGECAVEIRNLHNLLAQNSVTAHRINEALCDVSMTVKQREHVGALLLSIINSVRKP